MRKQLIFGIGWWLMGGVVTAQPVGKFLTDSIEIGRPFGFSLTYRHPPTAEVLFPDTVRAFSPFRVLSVKPFTTKTTGNGAQAVSLDSAVYTLVSFQTDSVQTLRVPIQILLPADCVQVFSNTDTVVLRSQLGHMPLAQMPLRTDTGPVPLAQELNYGRLAMVAAVVGAALWLITALFGRFFQRQISLFRLSRRHVRFLETYDRLVGNLHADTAADTVNQAVVRWKSYVERLENRPYASLTTSEIADHIGDERVVEALRYADRMAYGGVFSEQATYTLQVLREMAERVYQRRRAVISKAG